MKKPEEEITLETEKKSNVLKELFRKHEISYRQLIGSFQGWNAYAKWGRAYRLRKTFAGEIAKEKHKRIEKIKNRLIKPQTQLL